MLAFSDRIEQYLKPAKSRRHVLRIIRDLLYLQPEGRRTDIGEALAYLARVTRRRAIVFVLSDFFDAGYEPALRAAALRHEIVALTLNDPRERELSDVGLLEVEDAESGERIVLDTGSARVRETWRRRDEEARERRRRTLAAVGVEEVPLSTDASYVEPLLRAFRARKPAR
jgi:uncharacterized protein (DUF58 family)